MNPIPATLDTLKLIKFLKREPAEHKGNAGKVVLIGGAPGMAGALIWQEMPAYIWVQAGQF